MLHLFPSQVEVAVTQPCALLHVLVVELERQRLGARDDLELVHLHLDLARGQVRVDSRGRARGDLAHGAEHELVANLVRDLRRLRRTFGIDHELREAALVAEVDEDEPAVVAPLRRPARQCEALPDVLLAELARHHVAPLHVLSLSASSAVGTSSSCWPGRRRVERSGPHSTIAFAPSLRACVSWPLSERPA